MEGTQRSWGAAWEQQQHWLRNPRLVLQQQQGVGSGTWLPLDRALKVSIARSHGRHTGEPATTLGRKPHRVRARPARHKASFACSLRLGAQSVAGWRRAMIITAPSGMHGPLERGSLRPMQPARPEARFHNSKARATRCAPFDRAEPRKSHAALTMRLHLVIRDRCQLYDMPRPSVRDLCHTRSFSLGVIGF